MQRIVMAIGGFALATAIATTAAIAQPQPNEPPVSSELTQVEPILPPGISDFNLELFGKLAYTWTTPDGERVIEISGDFSARMGSYRLSGRDAVIWFSTKTWKDQTYIDFDIFLWQDAEVVQPGGTVENGPVLLVTLRTFGKLVLNVSSHASGDDSQGGVYQEAVRARKLLQVSPAGDAEKTQTPVRIAPNLEALQAAQRKPPKQVEYSADETYKQQLQDQSVIISIGDVFIAQGSPAESGEYVELRADAAVLFAKGDKLSGAVPELVAGGGKDKKAKGGKSGKQTGIERPPEEVPPTEEPKLHGKSEVGAEQVREWVSAVYLEGDVILTRGQRMIRASKLYYDFEHDRALVLDAVTRALEPSRNLPIYIRAQKIQQLTATQYRAERAQITTSEFHTPHVAIGAREVTFEDKTPRNERGEIIGVQAGTYKAKDTTINLDGVPIAYWPYSTGDFSRDRQAFRSAKLGYKSDFGASVETQWYLYNLLGLQAPEGHDATLKLDYFSDRGPAAGIDADYQTDDYYGLLRTYYIYDHGDDDLGGGRGGPPDHENRGRALARHRQILPKGWQLTLEGSYLSDDQFLESFERNEFENGKDQETLVHLLKRQDNWQFSSLLNYRLNQFQTQTEHFGDSMFSLIGEPLGDYATLYSESRAGGVRYRPDERRYFNGQNRKDNTGETGMVARGDTREELQFPVPDLGPLKLTPYVMGRLTGWDDSPDSAGGGGEGRGFGAYGVRGNMIAARTFDNVESELFDLHRLRHVIKGDFALWNAHTNVAPDKLSPFDSGVEDIDDFGGGTVGLRQRLQTKRGGPGNWKTVDWITFDLEAGFFHDKEDSEYVPNKGYGGKKAKVVKAYEKPMKTNATHGDYIAARPEDSISSNFIAPTMQYRLSDSTVLVYDGVYDVNRDQMGTSNISLAVEREPRMSYFIGWRYIHDTESNLGGLGFNYKLTEKHTIAFRELYDLEEGRNYSTEVIYIRKWPRWYTGVAFDVDRTLDDVGITLSIWPEGAPKLGLGSKRYTGLADDVGLSLR